MFVMNEKQKSLSYFIQSCDDWYFQIIVCGWHWNTQFFRADSPSIFTAQFFIFFFIFIFSAFEFLFILFERRTQNVTNLPKKTCELRLYDRRNKKNWWFVQNVARYNSLFICWRLEYVTVNLFFYFFYIYEAIWMNWHCSFVRDFQSLRSTSQMGAVTCQLFLKWYLLILVKIVSLYILKICTGSPVR